MKKQADYVAKCRFSFYVALLYLVYIQQQLTSGVQRSMALWIDVVVRIGCG